MITTEQIKEKMGSLTKAEMQAFMDGLAEEDRKKVQELLLEELQKRKSQQQLTPEELKQKELRNKQLSADVASLEYIEISNKRNEKFAGVLMGIINQHQAKGDSVGTNSISDVKAANSAGNGSTGVAGSISATNSAAKESLNGADVLDLTEKVKFVDEKGQPQEYSVDDLATNNKFATLSDVAQQNFLKAFSDPDRGKSPLRLLFDKGKKGFLAIFGVVGTGAPWSGRGCWVASTVGMVSGPTLPT